MTAQEASKTPKMAFKTAKMAPRKPNMAAICLQDDPRCIQHGLGWPQDGPRRSLRPQRGAERLTRGPKKPQ